MENDERFILNEFRLRKAIQGKTSAHLMANSSVYKTVDFHQMRLFSSQWLHDKMEACLDISTGSL